MSHKNHLQDVEEENLTETDSARMDNSNKPTQPNLHTKASGTSDDSVFVNDDLEMESRQRLDTIDEVLGILAGHRGDRQPLARSSEGSSGERQMPALHETSEERSSPNDSQASVRNSGNGAQSSEDKVDETTVLLPRSGSDHREDSTKL